MVFAHRKLQPEELGAAGVLSAGEGQGGASEPEGPDTSFVTLSK